tara:strand:+ start:334 stop:633 length:300 start_codon:yes stop_codon:yes gene_type:complete
MASGIYQFSTQEGLNLELAQAGCIYRAPTGVTGYSDNIYIAVTALEAASASACTVILTSVDSDVADSMTIELPVGTTVYGRWSMVALAANEKVILYKGS